jgi:tRNA U34 5-methylaminomethyl-2-thiouridine-forming methyltransferase MnmC
LQRKIVITADGSKTIHLVEWNEHYHSIHGAIQEANHVFIKHGLLFFVESFPMVNSIQILEIGFGTGLNAYITSLEAKKLNILVNYVGVEAFPITSEEIDAMNFSEQLDDFTNKDFDRMHKVSFDGFNQIH